MKDLTPTPNNDAISDMLQSVVICYESIKVPGLHEELIMETKPSVETKDIAFYEDMRKNFESIGQEAERRRSGFSFDYDC